MESMSSAQPAANPANQFCPTCGSEIPAAAPDGLCPKCLMRSAKPDSGSAGSGGGRFEAPPAAELQQLLSGYDVCELIGQGGMGAVYKGRHGGLDRDVAIKVLQRGAGGAEDFEQRFIQEGRAMAKLAEHPGIVSVFDSGEAGEFLFIVMELVEGKNLAGLMAANELSAAESLKMMPKICDAIAEMHAQGIIHRDLTPANILVTPEGEPKVADFGLARIDAPDSVALTGPNARLGTPGYAAPETIAGATADHRADVFALGFLFYEMLAGRQPLGSWTKLSNIDPALSPKLDGVLAKAMLEDPAARQQSVTEFAQQLLAASKSKSSGFALKFAAALTAVAAAGVLAAVGMGKFGGEAPALETKPEPVAASLQIAARNPFERPTQLGELIAIPRPGGELVEGPVSAKKPGQVANIPPDLGEIVAFSVNGLAYNAIAIRPDGTVHAWGNPEIPEGVSGVASAYAGQFKDFYLLYENDCAFERLGQYPARFENIRGFDVGLNLPAAAVTAEGKIVFVGRDETNALDPVDLPPGLDPTDVIDLAFDERNCALLDKNGVVHFAPRHPFGTKPPSKSDLRGVVDIECPGYSQFYLLRDDGRVTCLEGKWVERISGRLNEITDAVAIHARPRETLSVRHADGSWSLFARPVPELPHWIEELDSSLAEQVRGAIDVQITRTHIFALMPKEFTSANSP